MFNGFGFHGLVWPQWRFKDWLKVAFLLRRVANFKKSKKSLYYSAVRHVFKSSAGFWLVNFEIAASQSISHISVSCYFQVCTSQQLARLLIACCTSFSLLPCFKHGEKLTRIAGFTKKRLKVAQKFYSELWKPSSLIDFVQISTLTVAFFDWVSKSFIIIK